MKPSPQTKEIKVIIYATLNLVELMKLGSGMDAVEHSAYVRLFCAHYNQFHDGLPDDDQRLCLIAGCASMKVWMRVRERVMSEFARVECADGKCKFVIENVLQGISEIKSRSTGNSANSRKRWEMENATALPSNKRRQSDGNAKTPDSSKRSLQTPDSSASPPARDVAPAPEGGGVGSSDKSEGEEFVVHNGKQIRRKVGNAIFDEKLGGYVDRAPPPKRKPPKSAEAPPRPAGNPGFRVRSLLSVAAIGRAREMLAETGMDVNHAMEVYDQKINTGERPAPDNANAAFPAWCRRWAAGIDKNRKAA